MAAFVKGDVVVLPFPFSDLSNAKRRLALVLAELARSDFILCLITSQAANDTYTTSIETNDFATRSLSKTSYAKANRVFTANAQLIAYKAGKLTPEKTNEIIAKLIAILQQ